MKSGKMTKLLSGYWALGRGGDGSSPGPLQLGTRTGDEPSPPRSVLESCW